MDEQRIAALGVTTRRVAFVCLDSHLHVIAVGTWYLRRCRSVQDKAERSQARLERALTQSLARCLIVERPAATKSRHQAARLAECLAAHGVRCGVAVERASLRDAAAAIGQGQTQSCAAALTARNAAFSRLLAPAHRRWIHSDDRVRDRRPMLAAVAIAYAAFSSAPALGLFGAPGKSHNNRL